MPEGSNFAPSFLSVTTRPVLRTLSSPTPPHELLAGWPDWLVIIAAVLAVAVGIWILGKLLRLALWLVFIALFVAGMLVIVGMLTR